jgi:hypothetical protein
MWILRKGVELRSDAGGEVGMFRPGTASEHQGKRQKAQRNRHAACPELSVKPHVFSPFDIGAPLAERPTGTYLCGALNREFGGNPQELF